MRKGKMLLVVCLAAFFLTLPSMAIARTDDDVGETKVVKEIMNSREERDNFLKNHQRSPLKMTDKLKFKHLNYYPIDLKFRFTGKIKRYTLDIRDPKYYATFLTTRGTKKRYVRYGQFTFGLNGKDYVLQLYKSILSDMLFVPFKDRTNGKETYSGGRYLDAEVHLPGYETVIDFNMAYNPSCVYNKGFICVLPPEENRLDIEIPAGEKNKQW